jgi:hypothetical protein
LLADRADNQSCAGYCHRCEATLYDIAFGTLELQRGRPSAGLFVASLSFVEVPSGNELDEAVNRLP